MTDSNPHPSAIYTRTFADGARAYIAGHPCEHNPYPPVLRASQYYAAWRDGWNHAEARGWEEMPRKGVSYDPGDEL